MESVGVRPLPLTRSSFRFPASLSYTAHTSAAVPVMRAGLTFQAPTMTEYPASTSLPSRMVDQGTDRTLLPAYDMASRNSFAVTTILSDDDAMAGESGR